MYQNSCGCNDDGLGFLTEALGIASTLFGGDDSGAGGASAAPITVSPQISTQISPQISPVFQQQFQPTNSAATAGTAQTLPAMPTLSSPGTNGAPGAATTYPPGYAVPNSGMPMVPSVPTDYMRFLPYVLGGVGLVVVYKIFSKSKYAQKKGA